MAATVTPWTNADEKIVGRNSASGLTDTFNRALRFVLEKSGLDPDATFTGFAPVFNVKAFGAIGDGATDSTPAIQSAVDAAFAVGGGIVYFPEGSYRVATPGIVPKSGVTFRGAGMWASTITLIQSNIATLNFSLLDTTADLSNVTIEHLGFRGNVAHQSTAVTNGGEDAFAIRLAGQSEHVQVRHCRFFDLGTASDDKGGGIVIAPTSAAKTLRHITVEHCYFDEIKNVCGVYISIPSGSPAGYAIAVRHNTFRGGGIQNCVYLAAGEENPVDDNVLRGCDVSHNTFRITAACDICIEVNGVEECGIESNSFTLLASCTPILVRRWVGALAVANNRGRDRSAGGMPFFSAVKFTGSQTQSDMLVTGNVALDFTTHSFQFDGITQFTTVTGNVARGVTRTGDRGYYLADCQHITLANNIAVNMDQYARIAYGSTPVRDIVIDGGLADDCGESGGSIIDGASAAMDVQGLTIMNMVVRNPKSGTSHFVNVDSNSSTDNVVRDNELPALNVVNPSHAADFRIVPKLLMGTTTWDPGSLADGAQATTTVTVTGASVGDPVSVGFSNSLQGQMLTGYVSSSNTVTVVLQNESGGTLDLASGTLKAYVWH